MTDKRRKAHPTEVDISNGALFLEIENLKREIQALKMDIRQLKQDLKQDSAYIQRPIGTSRTT